MNWTPETLARAFHESYAHVSPKFFGTTAQAAGWNEIPTRSRDHLIAVAAHVLGTPFEMPMPVERVVDDLEAVPDRVVFRRAAAVAVEEAEDGLSNWEEDLRRQIDEASRKARDLLRNE